ncbi:hypothetical protein [Allonocardiopsis opalescens]|uniref:hypothetical protein n=1 Tax=Allonocardiopsis opalescens TaxID=1144618 RepID=UPI0011B22CFF|nr:hypothetical protein [Allonocardiopsis opalescens]
MAEAVTWVAGGTLGILAAVLVAGIAIGAASMHWALLPRLRRLERQRDDRRAALKAKLAAADSGPLEAIVDAVRETRPEGGIRWPDAVDRMIADASARDTGGAR